MQRRPSHPYSQFTGLVVVALLMLSVGMMFWMPSAPDHVPALAADVSTNTPALPITRTPRPERGPQANGQTEPTATDEQGRPLTDAEWAAIPTAIPADQLIPPTPSYVPPAIVQSAPEIIYQPAEQIVVTQAPLIVVEPGQRVVQTATPIVLANNEPLRQQDERLAAELEAHRQEEKRLAAELAAARHPDFASPDPNAKCQFVGCLNGATP